MSDTVMISLSLPAISTAALRDSGVTERSSDRGFAAGMSLRRYFRAFFPIALFVASFAVFGEEPGVSVHFAVEPSHVLAGIRPTFHITVQNDTASEIELPVKVLLLVTPAGGAPFIAEFGMSQESPFSRAELPAPRVIKAHEQREYWYRSRTLDGDPGWFYDPRLNALGTYRLQLLLADKVVDSKVGPTPAFKIDSAVTIRVRSDEAVFTVETPRGDDAVLWSHLVNLAHSHHVENWTARLTFGPEWQQFTKEAVEKYPASPYAPLVVRAYCERKGGERLPTEERLANAKRVLAAQPNTANRDDLELFMAEMEVTSAQEAAAFPKRDIRRAIALYDRARSAFENVERTTTDPEIRERSRQERERLPSADDLREDTTSPSDDADQPPNASLTVRISRVVGIGFSR